MSGYENPCLRSAMRQLFAGSMVSSLEIVNRYLQTTPRDPLAHSMAGAVQFYDHISSRMHANSGETLVHVLLGKAVPVPPALKQQMGLTFGRARSYARDDPGHPNTIFALCLLESVKRDYFALVTKSWIESLRHGAEANALARKLIAADPGLKDAYFVFGFSEYMMHQVPAPIRPFVSIPGIRGQRRKAIDYCEIAVESGFYCQEFARRLLVSLYLEEGRYGLALKMMTGLAEEFPDNELFVRELAMVRRRAG
jgi:hypothetical protein